MLSFIAIRISAGFLTVLAVLLLAGALVRVVPGDPVSAMLAQSTAAISESGADLRKKLGLDQPGWRQVGAYTLKALSGDLGESYRFNEPVIHLIAEKLPNTLLLAFAGLAIAVLVGGPIGVVSAVNRLTPLDTFLTALAVLFISIPAFWLGLTIIQIVVVQLRWVQFAGTGLRSLTLPALTLGIAYFPLVARMTRSSVIDVLSQEFVRTARSRGLPERHVMIVHVLRPAMSNLLAIVGAIFTYMICGQVVIENVFAWNGLGRLAVSAMLQRDYPLVQGFVVVVATCIVITTTLIDILHRFLDPRLRL